MLDQLSTLGETAGQRELKAALTHFIERIEIHGQDVTIEYSFKKPAIAKVPTNGDPGGAPDSRVQPAYIVEILCPTINEIRISTMKLSALQRGEIFQKHGKRSLRELAKEYNVSYETVRRIEKKDICLIRS